MMPDFDSYAPFSMAPLPMGPQVNAGGFGWMPSLPPLPPRYQGEWRNPAARPSDAMAPVSESLGPLGPLGFGAGRVAGPAGGLLARYVPWGAAGALAGAPVGALDYAQSGGSPVEGAFVGGGLGAAAGVGGRAAYGTLRGRPPTGGMPAPQNTWMEDVEAAMNASRPASQAASEARMAAQAAPARQPLAERLGDLAGQRTVYDVLREHVAKADELAGPMAQTGAPATRMVRGERLTMDPATGRWRDAGGKFREQPDSAVMGEGFSLDKLLAARRR